MRLRTIRYRDGRAPLTVLHTPMNDGPPERRENWRGKLLDHAKAIGAMSSPDSQLTGYVIVGLFSDGSSSAGFRLPEWLGPTLAPSYIAEILRRDGLMHKEASAVFDEMFQWVE